MADPVPVDELAESIFKMVKQNAGLKQFKAMDLQKAMIEMFPGRVDKKAVKAAIKLMIDSGRLIYTYFGGSYIELPHQEGAANPDE